MRDLIQAQEETGKSDLHWLTDDQVERLQPFFRKSRGKPRVDDRRMLSGIVFVNRNGLRRRDATAERTQITDLHPI